MKHIDSHLHVRGESQYVDDVPPPAEMLHAAVYGSPCAHGIIENLDLEKARAVDGVMAIFRAEDLPGTNCFGPIFQDEELLASSEVNFIGQPVAIIVAKTPEIARKAREEIEAEISPLPVVVDPRVAFKNGDFVDQPRTNSMGDVEETWKDCDFVVEGRCDMAGQEHVYLETHRARAIPREDRCLQIFASTQSPAALQSAASVLLGLPIHKIEVDVKRLGGGFGGKEDQATHWGCMAGMCALLLQKPVELVLNRLEDIQMTGKRHPYSCDFKMGLTKEGKILAYDVSHYQNSGAFADLSTPVLERTIVHSTNAYYIPNVRVFAAPCRTNLPSNTAFRGFGGPQGMFVIESAINKAAEVIGMPAEEIQAKNLISEGQYLFYGQPIKNCTIGRTWKQTCEDFDLEGVRQRVKSFNEENFAAKKGFALMPICFGISFTKYFLNQGNSLVHVYLDGSVGVTTGGIEMGQGISTNMATIAARTFGIREDRIKVESTNTTRVANMSPSAASATTDLNGNATICAVEQILDGMKEVALVELGVEDKSKVQIVDEVVFYDGSESVLTWEELVLKTYMKRRRLSAHGYYSTPGVYFNPQKGRGNPFAYHVFGTSLIEVTVDCLRGIYTIDQAKIVHDIGRSINKTVDIGQVEGALAQGLGWMTLEDLQFGEDGRCLSHALSTYKAPDVYFMPDDMEVRFLEDSTNKFGPLGTKAVGEPPFMYGIAVFFALRNAMKAFSPKTQFEFNSPLTPERVLMELHKDIPLIPAPAGKGVLVDS